MKIKYSPILILTLGAIYLAGCGKLFQPNLEDATIDTQPNGPRGTVAVGLSIARQPFSSSSDQVKASAVSDIKSVLFTCQQSNISVTQSVTISGSSNKASLSLTGGNWVIRADFLNDLGGALFTGTANVAVTPNQTTTANIALYSTQGMETLTFTGMPEGTTEIDVTATNPRFTTVVRRVTQPGNSAETRLAVPAGVWAITALAKDNAGTILATTQKTVTILGKPNTPIAFYFGVIIPELLFISGGTFMMGSPETEYDRSSIEGPQHFVTLNPFYIGKYEVTIAEFEVFINATGYKTSADSGVYRGKGSFVYKSNSESWDSKANWRCGVDGSTQTNKSHPVIHLSWKDAVAYCKWLTQTKGGGTYRLPTEAEWEYACRASTSTPFNTGENLTTDQANYDGNKPYNAYPNGVYLGTTTPVGSYAPNAWGLYDMHGNVLEWCQDRLGSYGSQAVTNPTGPETGPFQVLRGGSWNHDAKDTRSAFRDYGISLDRYYDYGFRVVFIPQ